MEFVWLIIALFIAIIYIIWGLGRFDKTNTPWILSFIVGAILAIFITVGTKKLLALNDIDWTPYITGVEFYATTSLLCGLIIRKWVLNNVFLNILIASLVVLWGTGLYLNISNCRELRIILIANGVPALFIIGCTFSIYKTTLKKLAKARSIIALTPILLFSSGVLMISSDSSHCSNGYRGAKITIYQIQKLDISLNNFKVKYSGLPGDIAYTKELGSELSLPPEAFGNGDGKVTDFDGNMDSFDGEMSHVFQMLGKAGMVEIAYQSKEFVIGKTIPVTKLKKGGISLAAIDGINYWYVGTSDGVRTENGKGISPLDAYSLDFKMDDGMPFSGNVQFALHLNRIGNVPAENKCVIEQISNGKHYQHYNVKHDGNDCAVVVKVSG